MALKLIYTSAPRLLQAGRSGLGTVAMSRGIPPQAVKVAESASQFSRQAGFPVDRVVYSYRTVRCSDGLWHLLSCVRDAGADYSGRTNHLAQHLFFDSHEASACAREGTTPAGIILGTAWPDHDGFCGWIEGSVHWYTHEPEPTWQWWTRYADNGDCRSNLSSEAALRGALLVYGKGLEHQTYENARGVLSLYVESQADCPHHGWGVTFTTSLEPNDELSDFRWIGVPENSPMLSKVEATGGRVRVTFETPPPAARQPTSVASGASLDGPAAAHDVGGDQNYASIQAYDAPTPAAGIKPTRNPQKEPKVTAKQEPFFKRPRVLTTVALSVLVAATAGFLFRSCLSEKQPEFQGSLSLSYDGNPKHALLSDGQPIFYRGRGSNDWRNQPPIDAGEYELGMEKVAWFGLLRQILPTGKVLEIKKGLPRISFPDNLHFVTSKESPKTWPIKPTINPPEAEVGKKVEYRWLKSPQSEWEEQAKSYPGEYEVRVSTRETPNFAAAVSITNFTISAPDLPESKTSLLVNLPSDIPATTPIAPAETDASSKYYLAMGSEALRLAKDASVWRENPNDIVVRQWGAASPSYRSIKGGRLEAMTSDFTMTPGGLPIARNSTSKIADDELVYRASYKSEPKEVYVVGLRSDGDNEGAVRNLLPGNAWLRLNTNSSVLELASTNEFFKSANLLPAGSKWILVYEDPPYSEAKQLKLESNTAAFNVVSQIAEAEKSRAAAAKKLGELTAVVDNYFDQNKPKLVKPLEQLLDPKLAKELAKQLAEQIANLPKPSVDKNDTSCESKFASALLIGALKIAHANEQVQPRIQLSTPDKNKIDGQLHEASSAKGGRNYTKIYDHDLLSLDELESWLAGTSNEQPSIREVRSAAVSWISYRVKNLQPPAPGTSALDDPVKMVLSKLRDGLDSCGDDSSVADPKMSEDALQKQIMTAEEEKRILSLWGTRAATGYARLELQLGQSNPPITLLPRVSLVPPVEAVK